jgi:histidinol dehydrogenase
MEFMVDNPLEYLDKIKNVALYFWVDMPCRCGDYYSGTNHILPTGGAADFPLAISGNL